MFGYDLGRLMRKIVTIYTGERRLAFTVKNSRGYCA